MLYSNLYQFIFIQLFINLNVLDSTIISNEKREKRYLVFPTPSSPAATKVQILLDTSNIGKASHCIARLSAVKNEYKSVIDVALIAGLGLPMNVDVSTIIGYVVKFNYFLPYNASHMEPYVRYERSIDDVITDDFREKGSSSKSVSRWNIYEMIELSLDSLGSGRGCLLRVICEAAGVPFSTSHGIFAELLHVLFTPSSTTEEYETVNDQEYHAAESHGRINPKICAHLFNDCSENALDYFSLIVHD